MPLVTVLRLSAAAGRGYALVAAAVVLLWRTGSDAQARS